MKYTMVRDRVEIYKDFALNLLSYIDYYYLDKEVLSSREDIYNHFIWCYNKVCDEFKLEGLDFSDNKDLINYYYNYYYQQYYTTNSTHGTKFTHHDKFWRNIFEINGQKNKNIINILVEIYNIQDKSIKTPQ